MPDVMQIPQMMADMFPCCEQNITPFHSNLQASFVRFAFKLFMAQEFCQPL
jgi:hypothetical protein